MFCIVYLASPRSFHIFDDPSQLSRLDVLKHSLSITKHLFPTTDIYVFHEDYTEEDFDPGVKEYIRVDFSGFEQHYNSSLRRPYGYLMMCRFFSGIMQSYPQLKKYTHYMRLDDDSFFTEPYLNESNVKDLLKHDYVYRSGFDDVRDQQSLYEATIRFLKREGYEHTLPTLYKELQKKCVVYKGLYTGQAPYNNFHIASQRLWQNPLVQRYVQFLEDEKGILRYGWMDANIHAMIMYILALYCGMKIHYVGWFGYRHNRHVSKMNNPAVDYVESLPFTLQMYSLNPNFKGTAYRLADNWFPFLPRTSGPIRYAEVGAFYGANLVSVAETYGKHPESLLIAIDPWTDYSDYPEYKGKQMTIYDAFQNNMTACGLQDRVTVKRGYSHEVLPTLEDDSFDLIYIDGNHEPEYVLEDAVLAFRKIKIGGHIVFDDYGWGGPDLTQRGIDAFVRAYYKRIQVLGQRQSQVFIRRTR